MIKYKGLLASSSDATGQTLSATIQGLVVILSSVIPLFAMQHFHLVVSADDVSSLITEVGIIAGAIATIRGLILKIINATGTVAVPAAASSPSTAV